MNRYIKSYTEKLNESIGNGSVLLIKGKPMHDGRYLYVTTIKGFAEIKPGIKMVFLGDTIYRVVYKGENKFTGRKVDYNGEEGLKGIFNMRQPGRPSIVLNHNKTPFHWSTLKHTDIGSALREIGPRLFSHDLILESNENQLNSRQYLVYELIKSLSGRESNIIVKEIEHGGEYDVSNFEADAEEKFDGENYSVDWDIIINFTIKDVDLPNNVMSEFGESIEGEMFTDIGVSADELYARISLTSDAIIDRSYNSGDRYTPPEYDFSIHDITTAINNGNDLDEYNRLKNIANDFYAKNIKSLSKDDPNFSNLYNEYKKLYPPLKEFISINDVDVNTSTISYINNDISILGKMIDGETPVEIIDRFKSIVGLNKSSNNAKPLANLEFEYKKSIRNINDEDLEKWKKYSNIDEKINQLEVEVNKLIEEQLNLESREGELTEDDIKRSEWIINYITENVPNSSRTYGSFTYFKNTNQQIDHLNKRLIIDSFTELKRVGSKSEHRLKLNELEYQKFKYLIAKSNILNKPIGSNIEKSKKFYNFFLKPEDQL